MKTNLGFYSLMWTFSLLAIPVKSQQAMQISQSCNFSGSETKGILYVDEPSNEAQIIVEKIMSLNGLEQNFKIKSSSCRNALATSAGNDRYILYNTYFLENFKKGAKTEWAAYCVLAHEIGHHLNFHNLIETDTNKRRQYELEADKFAGGVLYRLGATLDQAQAGVFTFGSSVESPTHPDKRTRASFIANGWKKMQELGLPIVQNTEKSNPSYPLSINTKTERKSSSKAISSFFYVKNNFRFDLLECKQVGKTIECVFQIVNNGQNDMDLNVYGSNSSKIHNLGSGFEYYLTYIKLAEKVNDREVSKTLIVNAPIIATLAFGNVRDTIKTISKIEIHCYTQESGYYSVVIRDIPLPFKK